MKKGFTLIELMIIIIIIAILAVIAIIQYQMAMERSRGSEAKEVIGHLRKMVSVIYDRDGSTAAVNHTNAGIGNEEGMIPADCFRSHYFNYSVEEHPSFENVVIFTATRCMKFGRPPNAKQAGKIILTVDYLNNTNTWSTLGVY